MLEEIERDKHHASMGIVMISDDYRKGELIESYHHGATGYLVYPFREFELSHLVNEAISHKAMVELEKTRYGISSQPKQPSSATSPTVINELPEVKPVEAPSALPSPGRWFPAARW